MQRKTTASKAYHYVHAADWPAKERDEEATRAGGLYIVELWNRMAYMIDYHQRNGTPPPDWEEIENRPLRG